MRRPSPPGASVTWASSMVIAWISSAISIGSPAATRAKPGASAITAASAYAPAARSLSSATSYSSAASAARPSPSSARA